VQKSVNVLTLNLRYSTLYVFN